MHDPTAPAPRRTGSAAPRLPAATRHFPPDLVPSPPGATSGTTQAALPEVLAKRHHGKGRCHHRHSHGDAVHQPLHPASPESHSNDTVSDANPRRRGHLQRRGTLHPHDRGPKGTHHGAIIANGNLYCPCTPGTLLELGPLARTATSQQAADHDRQTAETARYKLGRLTADDEDGYHRVQCPAAMGKIRCPLRPASMTLDRDRPEILTPPGHPQACCTRQTLTVPPDVNAKTRGAVGTALAGGPPHRSQRAGLPHWAPTSGA